MTLIAVFKTMAKEKFSKKLRSGKAKLMPQEKKDNMSHIGKRKPAVEGCQNAGGPGSVGPKC